jgi:TatD DNase family protein
MASEFNLPMFLHERDAFEDFYTILCEMKDELGDKFLKIVIHCFTSSQEALETYIKFGAYIGITGFIAKNKRGQDLRQFVHLIPLDKLMIETDAPWMKPDSGDKLPWKIY